MKSARSLFAAHLGLLAVSFSLALLSSLTPVAWGGDYQEVARRIYPLHPALGITDDPGPFGQIALEHLSQGAGGHALEESDPQADEGAGQAPPPMVRYNPVSGFPMAVWSDRTLGIDGILFTHFTVGGWVEPVLLAEGADDPVLAIDPVDGSVHLVYGTRGDGGTIWHRETPADLTSWTASVRVSAVREAAARPDAIVHEGRMTIAYESHLLGLGSSQRQIVVAHRDGSDYARTVLAHTDYAERNWVRLDRQGSGLLVRWIHLEHQMGWVLSERDGSWGPVHLRPIGGALSSTRGGKARTRR